MPTRSSTTTRSLAVPDQVLALLDTPGVIEYPDHLDTLADTAAISTLTIAELADGAGRCAPPADRQKAPLKRVHSGCLATYLR